MRVSITQSPNHFFCQKGIDYPFFFCIEYLVKNVKKRGWGRSSFFVHKFICNKIKIFSLPSYIQLDIASETNAFHAHWKDRTRGCIDVDPNSLLQLSNIQEFPFLDRRLIMEDFSDLIHC